MKIKLVVIVVFLMFTPLLLSPKTTHGAQNIIRVSGYQYGTMWYPLTHPDGSPPLSHYLTTLIYGALKNTDNFGPTGIVPCSLDIASQVDMVREGSLVDSEGNLLVDVFFGGAKLTKLNQEEAIELVKFINAGGVL